MTTDPHDLAGAYALDALSEAERQAFEAHYATCPRCIEEVASFQESAAVLAAGASQVPPRDLKQQVMATIGSTPQVSAQDPAQPASAPDPSPVIDARSRFGSLGPKVLAVAAALVLLVGAVVLTRDGDNRYDDVVASADAVPATLQGADGAEIHAVWSPSQGEVAIEADDLPPLGDDETYALWRLVEGTALPAGLFVPNEDGSVRAVLEVDLAPEADPSTGGWGITVEPAGGSPQPTGDVLFA